MWGSLPQVKVINYVASCQKRVETRLSLCLNTLFGLVNCSCCCRPFFGSFRSPWFLLAVVTAVMVSSWFAKQPPLHLGVSVCGRLENLFCNLLEPMFRSPPLNSVIYIERLTLSWRMTNCALFQKPAFTGAIPLKLPY